MKAEDCIALIEGAVEKRGGAWADLGSGRGSFTAALAELIGPGGLIYSVDVDAGALRVQQSELPPRFPRVRFEIVRADFTAALDLPALDGALMANALHFQEDQCAVLTRVGRWLRPGGVLAIVEYDIEASNHWVPHPVPFSRLPEIASCAGFSPPRLIATLPSRYHRRMYCAACLRQPRSATGT